MSTTGRAQDSSLQRETADIGTTYFPYSGPTTAETSFNSPIADGNSKRQTSGRDMDFPGDTTDKSTISIRPRPLHDQQSLVFMSPNYPGPVYIPITPPYNLSGRESSVDSFYPKRSRNPYTHMKPINAGYCVVFMAILFLAALIAAMFMAIYFGQKY